jgi:hypothetical protein
MRRLCRSVTGIALLAVLSGGCGGSTAHDRLVLRFLRFDNAGITQSDQVRETGADVDVLQECCSLNPDSTCAKAEPFTQTSINAVFRNEQAADILLTGYTVDYGPNSGLPNHLNLEVFDGKLHGALSTNIVGGRCSSNISTQCAVDADCSGGVGGAGGLCNHTETAVSGILLVDFDVKENIAVGTRNVLVTFYGSDALQSFQTSAGYVIRFDDFNSCAAAAAGQS